VRGRCKRDDLAIGRPGHVLVSDTVTGM